MRDTDRQSHRHRGRETEPGLGVPLNSHLEGVLYKLDRDRDRGRDRQTDRQKASEEPVRGT